MLDATQLPILLKAIDFIFDEGRKILEERRQRRTMNEKTAEIEPSKPADENLPEEPKLITETKQDLIASKIDEMRWKSHEKDVNHLMNLLESYSTNYRISKEKYAKWGSTLVPPVIVHEMEEAEKAMIETTGKLETLLSKIYKKDNTSPK